MSRTVDAFAQARINLFDQFYEQAEPCEKNTLDAMKQRVMKIHNMGEVAAKELIWAVLSYPALDRMIRKD